MSDFFNDNGPNPIVLDSPAAFQLDAMPNLEGESVSITMLGLVRIVCLAAEAGARFQKEAISIDPLCWMLTPLALLEGRAPIEACVEEYAYEKALLLHGLSLGLDAPPSVLDHLLGNRAPKMEAGHE